MTSQRDAPIDEMNKIEPTRLSRYRKSACALIQGADAYSMSIVI